MTTTPSGRLSLLARRVRALGDRQGGRAVVIQTASYIPKVLGVLAVGRFLTAEEVAVYGVLTALMAVLAVTMPFSAYLARSRPGTGGRITTAHAASALMDVAVLLALVAFGILPGVRSLIEAAIHVPVPAKSYALALLLFAASGLATVGQVWLRSDLRYVSAAWVATAPEVLWIVPFLLAAALTPLGLDVLLAARLVAAAIAGAYAVWVVPWSRLFAMRPGRGDVAIVSSFALPLVLVSGSITIVGVADRLVLGRYVSLEDLGRYTFMYLLFSGGAALSLAIVQVMNTHLAALANAGEWEQARSRLVRIGLGVTVVPIALGVLIWLLRPLADAVADKPLLPAGPVIILTGLGIGLLNARFAWQTWFQLHFRTVRLGAVEVLVTALYAISLVALTSRFGVLGAALAMVVANTAGAALCAVRGRHLERPV